MTKKKEKTTKYGLQNSENTTRLASRKGLVASHLQQWLVVNFNVILIVCGNQTFTGNPIPM